MEDAASWSCNVCNQPTLPLRSDERGFRQDTSSSTELPDLALKKLSKKLSVSQSIGFLKAHPGSSADEGVSWQAPPPSELGSKVG